MLQDHNTPRQIEGAPHISSNESKSQDRTGQDGGGGMLFRRSLKRQEVACEGSY